MPGVSPAPSIDHREDFGRVTDLWVNSVVRMETRARSDWVAPSTGIAGVANEWT